MPDNSGSNSCVFVLNHTVTILYTEKVHNNIMTVAINENKQNKNQAAQGHYTYVHNIQTDCAARINFNTDFLAYHYKYKEIYLLFARFSFMCKSF